MLQQDSLSDLMRPGSSEQASSGFEKRQVVEIVSGNINQNLDQYLKLISVITIGNKIRYA